MTRGLADFQSAELRAWRLNLYARQGSTSRTAEELAEAVGTTKAQILAYENGHRVPDPPRIRSLARALDIHPVRLMNMRNAEEWSIADLRRACGLRAEDVTTELGMSPKNYRRFENEGIVPSRRPQFLDEVAAAFGLPRENLGRAIDATPAVRRRREIAAELVRNLADRYVPAAGPWKGPEPNDPDLLELAAAYGRPVGRTRRVLTYELSELRQKHLRALRERVLADFDMDRERQASAHHAVERWETLREHDLKRIPDRLEQFHRNAQPSDIWQALVDLFNVDAVPRADAPWAVTKFLTDNPECLAPYLIEKRTAEDIAVCRLTHAGFAHISAFASLYAALYPPLRKPLRPPVRTASRSRNLPPSAQSGIQFVLPRNGTGSPVKLVIPTPALDTLLTSDSAKAVPIDLSPRYLLSLQAHGGGIPGATVFEIESDPFPQVIELFDDDPELHTPAP